MKIMLPLRFVYLMGWLALLFLGAPLPSAAQDTTPIPKITPLWTIHDECYLAKDCGELFRMSADGEHLFRYVAPPSIMYVYSKRQNKVASYKVLQSPITTFPNWFDQAFDFFPLDDHVILYPDRASGGILMWLDLLTGKSHVFGVERGLVSCLNYWYPNSLYPPVGAFHYLPAIHALLVCRTVWYGYGLPHFLISTLDLKSGQLTNVIRVGEGKYSYINVVGGRNGSVYLEPSASEPRIDGTRLIMRWNTGTLTWDKIEIPDSILDNNDFEWLRFMGVDTQSNLYFQSILDKDPYKLSLTITKVNPTTKVAQVIKEDQLGWNPYFVGLDNSGQMIILNRISLPSSNATVDVISRYEFDATSSTAG